MYVGAMLEFLNFMLTVFICYSCSLRDMGNPGYEGCGYGRRYRIMFNLQSDDPKLRNEVK